MKTHLENRKLSKWRKSFVVARILVPGVIHPPRRENHHRQLAACLDIPVKKDGLRGRHVVLRFGVSVDTIFTILDG